MLRKVFLAGMGYKLREPQGSPQVFGQETPKLHLQGRHKEAPPNHKRQGWWKKDITTSPE